ncbi:hypothetical protein QYE76_027650 [Lolium multiflorum]|uniref:Transposase (putative) gypsy type domain-containing protein n=1 Tax=Lolium multiflorum TaxID=4521 RepID=A0AAD8VDS7_LOLMU|nr:hypothetical protein QYE76_027650 [Lolium multiflorum]
MVLTWRAGFSFPPSDFFLEILKVYGLQPHNISPNSVLAISNHVTLCEGHLRVPPELSLFQYYFSVKKEKVRQSTELATCGSITFMIRPGRVYPHTDRHESARHRSWGLLLSKGRLRPSEHKKFAAVQELPRHRASRGHTVPISPTRPTHTQLGGSRKPTEEGLTGKDLTLSWFTADPAAPTQGPAYVPKTGRDDPMRATKDNLSADAIDKRIRILIKIPRELHVHVCNKDIHMNGSGTASTRKLHEDLRVHVLEQMTEIEGLRQTAESSRQAVLRLEARLKEETDKRPTIDALSAKVQVLEAETESLKNFLKESSEKETKEKKELSEKHAHEMAELADKLKKSHQRVTTLAAKNKSQEAEAEAIDKLIFPSLGFEWTKDSTLTRTEAYDEARTSIVNLVEACRGIAKSLSLKKAKTTVIDRMTKLMQNVPELIKDWQESSSRGVAALVLATCKAHFPTMKFADVARGVHKDTTMRQLLSEAMGFDRLFAGRVNHSFWYNKYDLPKGFSDPEEEEEAAEEGDEEGSGSSADHDEGDSDFDDGSGGGSDDGSAYVASDEEQSSENL